MYIKSRQEKQWHKIKVWIWSQKNITFLTFLHSYKTQQFTAKKLKWNFQSLWVSGWVNGFVSVCVCDRVSLWPHAERKVSQLDCFSDWKTVCFHSPVPMCVVCHSVKRSTRPINIVVWPMCPFVIMTDYLENAWIAGWRAPSESVEDVI